jgi:putative addiction module component (TIGR02574 family)
MLATLGLDGLSPEERLTLIEELWESLSTDPEQVPVTDAQKADLAKRLAAFRADPKAGSSWEEVKARLQGRS